LNARCTQPGEHVRERIVSPLQVHVHDYVYARLLVQVSNTRAWDTETLRSRPLAAGYAGSRRRMERANSLGNPASRGGKPRGLVHARGIAACRRRIIQGVCRRLRCWPPRAMRA
jgi:hypothetical protein